MKHLFTKEFWLARDVELFIGQLLRYGVMTSCVITFIGGIFYLFQHNGVMPDYSPTPSDQPFAGVAHYLRELNTIIPGVLALDGASIIQLGVVVLIATPVIRVIFSAFSFLIERDYLYVVITVIVFCIIMANMVLGLH